MGQLDSPVMVAIEQGKRDAGPEGPAQPGRAERRRRIVDEVTTSGGFADVRRLVERLGVSPMTIRRDLAELERAGAIRRTRGGALAPAGSFAFVEPALVQRRSANAEAKRLIARRAAQEVAPGGTIGIDVGTTTLALCLHLVDLADLTVVTSSLPVAVALAGSMDVYLPGGRIRPKEQSLVGAAAREGMARFHLDTVFVGAAGIDEHGIYDYSIEDTELKQVMIDNADRVIVLCDASKFGRRAVATVCSFARIGTLVTDDDPPAAISAALVEHGVRVIVAGRE